MRKFKVAVIGECMVELAKVPATIAQQAAASAPETLANRSLFTQAFGGDSLNTAVYLKRLYPHAQVSYLTGVGADALSQEMVQLWQDNHLDVAHVRTLPQKFPGLYTISLAPNGERSFAYWRNDSAAKYWIGNTAAKELAQELGQFDLVYLSGISLAVLPPDQRKVLFDALELLQDSKTHGAQRFGQVAAQASTSVSEGADTTSLYHQAQEDHFAVNPYQGTKERAVARVDFEHTVVAFDNNYRPLLWPSQEAARESYRKMLSLTDVAFLTFDDEEKLWGDKAEKEALERTFNLGVSEVVVKHGPNPCTIATPNKKYSVKGVKVDKVVDTTAAGDSFSAGYLAGRFAGHDYEAAAQVAHALASTVIQHKGALIPEEFCQDAKDLVKKGK